MISHNSYEYGRREYHRTHEDNAALALVGLAVAVLGIGFYLLVSRFHIRTHQIVELSFYLIALTGAGISVVWYLRTRKKRIENAWPHPAVFVPMLKDHRYMLSELLTRMPSFPGMTSIHGPGIGPTTLVECKRW
jgi:hypothetical protein